MVLFAKLILVFITLDKESLQNMLKGMTLVHWPSFRQYFIISEEK